MSIRKTTVQMKGSVQWLVSFVIENACEKLLWVALIIWSSAVFNQYVNTCFKQNINFSVLLKDNVHKYLKCQHSCNNSVDINPYMSQLHVPVRTITIQGVVIESLAWHCIMSPMPVVPSNSSKRISQI